MAAIKKAKKKTSAKKTAKKARKTVSKKKKSVIEEVFAKKPKHVIEDALSEDFEDELEDELEDEELDLASDDSDDLDADNDDDESEEEEESGAVVSEAFLKARINEDAFDYGSRVANAGYPIFYHIRRNGQWLSRKSHPYGWDELQKEYGGGVYQIECKDESFKRIRRKTTQSIEGYPKKVTHPEPEEKEESSSFGIQDVLAMQASAKAEAKDEFQRAIEQDKMSQSSLMTLILSTQNQTSRSMTEMMAQLQRSQMDMIKTINDSNQKSFEIVQKQIESLASNQNKREEFGMKDILLLMNSSKTEGIELYTRLLEHAEAKSSDRDDIIQQIAELKAEKNSGKERSGIDTLIEALAPVLPALMTAQQQRQVNASTAGQPVLPQPPAMTAEQAEEFRKRRILHERERQRTAANTKAVSQTQNVLPLNGNGNGNGKDKPMKVKEFGDEGKIVEDQNRNGFGDQGDIVHDNNPRQDFGDNGVVVEKADRNHFGDEGEIVNDASPARSFGGEASEVIDYKRGEFGDEGEVVSEDTPPGIVPNAKVKARIQGLLSNKAVTWILSGAQAERAADESLQILRNGGILREEILVNYSENDLLNLASQYQLPRKKVQWLKEYWSYVEQKLGAQT